jgi:hypothetical protein
MPAGPADPGDLFGLEGAATLDDEVEMAVGIRQSAALAQLEGDPALGVEPNASDRALDSPLGAIDPPNTRAWELAGQEEDSVALAAADLEDSFR